MKIGLTTRASPSLLWSMQNGGPNKFFVPLVAANPDTPFVMELRYTLKGDGSQFVLPAFSKDTSVVKAWLGVYLPESQTLLGVGGPWTEEFRWRCNSSLQRRPSPTVDPDSLARWVRGEETSAAGRADDFQTDGQLYLYSTLRPADGPAGSLEMTIVNDRSLKGLVFAVTVLLGLLLLPARLPVRVLVIGAAVIGLVLAGVFLPTFSMQLLNGVFLLAIFIVAVLWALACVARCRKCRVPAPVATTVVQKPSMDVPQTQPEPPAVESPKPESQEGGQDHA